MCIFERTDVFTDKDSMITGLNRSCVNYVPIIHLNFKSFIAFMKYIGPGT